MVVHLPRLFHGEFVHVDGDIEINITEVLFIFLFFCFVIVIGRRRGNRCAVFVCVPNRSFLLSKLFLFLLRGANRLPDWTKAFLQVDLMQELVL